MQSLVEVIVYTESHDLYSGTIDINGTTVTATSGVIDTLALAGVAASSMYTFENSGPVGADGGFYVGAIVVTPIPGAAWLFGSGLLGFGWLRRRWRRVQETVSGKPMADPVTA